MPPTRRSCIITAAVCVAVAGISWSARAIVPKVLDDNAWTRAAEASRAHQYTTVLSIIRQQRRSSVGAQTAPARWLQLEIDAAAQTRAGRPCHSGEGAAAGADTGRTPVPLSGETPVPLWGRRREGTGWTPPAAPRAREEVRWSVRLESVVSSRQSRGPAVPWSCLSLADYRAGFWRRRPLSGWNDGSSVRMRAS